MKIVHTQPKKEMMEISAVQCGECFYFNRKLFLKVANPSSKGLWSLVDLSTGELMDSSKGQVCTPVKAEIHVEPPPEVPIAGDIVMVGGAKSGLLGGELR